MYKRKRLVRSCNSRLWAENDCNGEIQCIHLMVQMYGIMSY